MIHENFTENNLQMVSLEVPTESPCISRRAPSEECEIAFSHDDPTLMWKDRTTDCVDLKVFLFLKLKKINILLQKVFSKFDSSAPISGEILFRARFLCAKYLGGAWRKVKIEEFRIRAIT